MYVVIQNWLLVLHECLMHVSCLVTSNKYAYIMYVRVCAGRDNSYMAGEAGELCVSALRSFAS